MSLIDMKICTFGGERDPLHAGENNDVNEYSNRFYVHSAPFSEFRNTQIHINL